MEIYLSPPSPFDSTVVDDPSDLTKNEFTAAERVEIVKKVGKDQS